MASCSESGKGAKRRTTLIPRIKINNPENSLNFDVLNNRRIRDNSENGKDSGLSSESSTPTGGSPPPRQQKIIVSPSVLSNSIVTNRGKIDSARISSARTSRLLRSRTGTDSPRSLDSVRTRQISSPFRPVLSGNGQTPSVDSGDEGSPRLERCNYHQDIVYIKTGLLKLMRIIQENGLFQNLNEESTTDTGIPLTNGALNVADELTDLRRQIIFLEGQLEDKDRMVQQLQLQVVKQQELINNADSPSCASSMFGSNISSTKEVSNAATQTEKIRPVSAGPSLLQGFPQDSSMGPLVSWSETWNRQNSPSQRPSSLLETNSTINIKSNHKTSDVLHRPIIKSRQEQSTSRLNGDTVDKISIDNTSIRRVVKTRDAIANKNLDSNNLAKEPSSKSDIPKSCIPSLKKVTTLTYLPRVARADILITGRSHNS